MTLAALFQLLRRRWWAVPMVLAMFLGAAWSLLDTKPVYWTQFDLQLVGPTDQGNIFDRHSIADDLTPMAGILASLVNEGAINPKTAEESAPLPGLGIHDGIWVTPKDEGIQWAAALRPALNVQIAKTDLADLYATADQVTDDARARLGDFQDELDIPAAEQIRLSSPVDVVVSPLQIDRNRALAGLTILGLIAALPVLVLLDRAAAALGRARHARHVRRTHSAGREVIAR